MTGEVARSLYFTGPGAVEIRTEELGPVGPEELLVETSASGVSPGSELLVYRGEFPPSLAVDSNIDALDDEFDYPLQYGYAAVGEVVAAGDALAEGWTGRRVFAFAPHGDRFLTGTDAVVPLGPELAAETATLLPSIETATNLVLDGQPRVGERVVVFGAGPVGLCTVHLLSQFPLASLIVVEPLARRQELATELGADVVRTPEEQAEASEPAADMVYELSGRPATIDDAIDAVGFDGRVVVGSWYGTKRAPIDLGGSFHRERISLVSSQVSTIAPGLRGRWDKERRFDTALAQLERLPAAALLGEEVPFETAPAVYERLDARETTAPHVVLRYQ